MGSGAGSGRVSSPLLRTAKSSWWRHNLGSSARLIRFSFWFSRLTCGSQEEMMKDQRMKCGRAEGPLEGRPRLVLGWRDPSSPEWRRPLPVLGSSSQSHTPPPCWTTQPRGLEKLGTERADKGVTATALKLGTPQPGLPTEVGPKCQEDGCDGTAEALPVFMPGLDLL